MSGRARRRQPSRRAGWASVALVLAAVTLTSRVVGFARSLVFSKTVGDTCLGDVYNAANTLPNTLFEIVAGGVLAGVVVPVVARHVSAERPEHTARTVSALLTWTILVLTVPGAAALAGAGVYARAFTQPACAGGVQTLAALLVMFVPQIWLYGVAVVSAGVLQAHQRFLAAAVAPLLSSVVVIAAYLGFAWSAAPGTRDDLLRVSRQALLVLGLGTTAGVLVLAGTSAVALGRLGLRLRPRLTFAAGDGRLVLSVAGANLAGLVLQQLSILEISWVTQRAGEPGALTRYVWAAAIYLLPYAVLASPLLQIVFPRLSAAASDPGAVTRVLRETAPTLTLAACLGGALLVATSVPVARVFVLGPGSGDTAALAAPIAAFAPAVLGFTLLGLASRTLLARHLAREAGVTLAASWGAVIVAVVIAWQVLPGSWLVTGVAGATSLGLSLGAALGWWLVAGGLPGTGWLAAALLRPLGIGLLAALAAGLSIGATGLPLADESLGLALLGVAGTGFGCCGVFLAVVALLDRGQLRRVWALRRPPAEPASDQRAT